jgi:hypothetical protein
VWSTYNEEVTERGDEQRDGGEYQLPGVVLCQLDDSAEPDVGCLRGFQSENELETVAAAEFSWSVENPDQGSTTTTAGRVGRRTWTLLPSSRSERILDVSCEAASASVIGQPPKFSTQLI